MAGWFNSYARWLTALLLLAVVVDTAPSGVLAAELSQGVPVSTVAVVYTSKKSYRLAAQSVAKSISASGHAVSLIELPGSSEAPEWGAALRKLEKLGPAVVVTGGRVATEWALNSLPDALVVYFMVPNIRDALFLKKAARQERFITGVSVDVSPESQIAWVSRVAPSARKIAILHSVRTRRTAEALEAAATAQGLTFDPIIAHRSSFPDAIRQLNARQVDGVVMIPDAQVYNSATVQRLLIWGVRHRQTIWAFSSNVVRAGAAAGQYADPQAVGHQTSQLVLEMLATGRASEATWHYAATVKYAVNIRTTALIGLDLDLDRIGVVQEFGEAK